MIHLQKQGTAQRPSKFANSETKKSRGTERNIPRKREHKTINTLEKKIPQFILSPFLTYKIEVL
jgi:hypothetical protein